MAESAHEPGNPERRLQVSLRLKAARYLAGRSEGKRAVALPVDELARHRLLTENGITKNRLDDYEQMKTDPRPMELEVIADALGVDRSFLLAPLGASALGEASLREEVAALRANVAQLVGVMTGEPEAGASLQDGILKLVEQAMTQRAREVGRRTLPPAKRPPGEGQRRAS